MKKLEFVDWDFDSLTLQESKRINGGLLGVTIAVLSAIIYLYNNQEDIAEGFTEGFMSTYEGD
jgi:hypothetical protein